MLLGDFIKQRLAATGLTQQALAEMTRVGLRFVREMEQGKETLRLDKESQVLRLFWHRVGAVPIPCSTPVEKVEKRLDW